MRAFAASPSIGPTAAGTARRYPVVYRLSSFLEDDRAPYAVNGAEALFDRAITRQVIGPVIVVAGDFTTPAGGSWYVNSAATGNWDDFMVCELVPWVMRAIARSPGLNRAA